jgi:hypothetical protein
VIKSILISCVGTCLLLLILEACSGVLLALVFFTASPWLHNTHLNLDQCLGWSLTPYATNHVVNHVKGFDVTYRSNRYFRLDGQDIRRVKACDVVILGDSHVFGYGLADDQTLAAQLHTRLSEGGQTHRVLNAGVPGYGPDQDYLRLQSLGGLAEGTLVIVYVSPMNDLVNLSTEIEYGYPKPHASLHQGRLAYSKPLLYDPRVATRFAPEFDRLNQVFEEPGPAPAPLMARLSRRSLTCRLVRAARERSLRFRWSRLAPAEEIDKNLDAKEYEREQQELFRKYPFRYLTGYWPAIAEFEAERQIAEETLRSIFVAMKQHVERQDAHLLVVIAGECYRDQAFWIHLGDILVERFPKYAFQWTLARDVVTRAAEQAGVSALRIEYPQDRIESMYIPYDGHTSAEGFSVVSREIVQSMERQGFIPKQTNLQ